MKIAVTGTHRVGKTTLIDQLQESLPEYTTRLEAYYELEEEGYTFAEIPTVDDYIKQLEYSIGQITQSGDNVIFDRCPLDMLAYIQATDEFGDSDIQTLYQRVQDSMKEIDLLVFIPIEQPDLIGCPQSDLPQLRLRVDEILNDLIWDFDVDTVQVFGSVEARKNQVLKYLSRI